MNNFNKLLEEYKKSNLNYKLPIILGEDEQSKLQFADLVNLQNIIIGGTTGSGKSTFIHSVISTLISMYPYEKLRLSLIDMKLVELQLYNGLPHLLAPVLPENGGTDFSKIYRSFEWLIEEKNTRKELSKEELDKHPYIVVVIDTFSDLIAYDAMKFENYISELTDHSDEVKIHTIICDSRTGSDVFTDHLLEDFQTRIAFNTYDATGSKLLIREDGAEKLRGSGDMLFLPENLEKAIRIQAPSISEAEVSDTIKVINK